MWSYESVIIADLNKIVYSLKSRLGVSAVATAECRLIEQKEREENLQCVFGILSHHQQVLREIFFIYGSF